jgi:putative SOS response-associated peptidase YedK
MCGRYGYTAAPNDMTQRFNVAPVVEGLQLRFNVAPTQTMPVVVRHSPNSLELMRWGLIPRWAKEPNTGLSTINARAETVAEKRTYRRPLQFQRCLVPASGFYEWQRTADGKVPHWIYLPDEPLFAFAGLWDSWTSPSGDEVHSYTIITCEANAFMAPIHNRMPMILSREAEEDWLNPDVVEPERLLPLLRPYPADRMAAHPVSRAVNNPRNDSPDLVRPVGAGVG